MRDSFNFLNNEAADVAPRLLGCWLVRETSGQRLFGRIVETEAYSQTDAASHSYHGPTPRTGVMFGSAGYAYVYFTYGMHYCLNVVTEPEGHGSAVLIRALEPIEGSDIMAQNRGRESDLCNGPAKLCQALGIDKNLNGHNLHKPPLQLLIKPPLKSNEIVKTTRIGITRDTHRPWRFYIRGNDFVSKSS